MTDLLAARCLFGVSLAFHIVFAAVGVAMPLLMVLSEWRSRRLGDETYLGLARQWAKGTAILFAVGAVSGTVISFELGLLWPRFMAFAGPIIGMPFSLEGFAFFAEAIFLGIYLYGWDRVGPRLHLAAGIAVAASGALSAFFVTLANAWMNSPAGFDLAGGRAADVRPFVAMFPPGWQHEVVHVLLSCYAATGLSVAGIHAFHLRRDPRAPLHRRALGIALFVGGAAALAQPFSGDLSARQVARISPLKLAALEGDFHTERGAPLRLGGLPDVAKRTTRYAMRDSSRALPAGLSRSAGRGEGTRRLSPDTWPNVRNVHLAFQVMVALGSAMAALALLSAFLALRARGLPTGRGFLAAVVAISPLGFVALEAGWLRHRVGATALHHPRPHAHERRGDAGDRIALALRRLRDALPVSRGGGLPAPPPPNRHHRSAGRCRRRFREGGVSPGRGAGRGHPGRPHGLCAPRGR